LLVLIPANRIGIRPGRLAVPVSLIAASIYEIAYIYGDLFAHDYIVAARSERVAGSDRDVPVTPVTEDFQTADHSPTVQVSIVQFVLADDVVFETVEILFRQQLTGEEARAAETLQAAADGAASCCWLTGGGDHRFPPLSTLIIAA
jgi:hypothetical protein